MAKIEVEEGEYAQLQALRGVASKIVANPAARKRLEEAHKMVDPNAATPTLDADAALTTPIREVEKNLSEQIAALKKEREDEKRQATLDAIVARQNDGLQRLRRAGYTDEGVTKIQKLMEDKGLLDVDDAVAIWERSNPPPLPSTPSAGGAWNFTDMTGQADKSIEDMLKTQGKNDQIVDRMALDILNEVRSARR